VDRVVSGGRKKRKKLKYRHTARNKPWESIQVRKIVDYFRGLAEETGAPYQQLIDLHSLDCANMRKKLRMK
jgi:hypothetical protein